MSAPRLKRDVHALDEGLMLADSAARLEVRNRIQVETIGRGRDYDAAEYHRDAAAALRQLALEQDEIAERLDAERKLAVRRDGYSTNEHDYQRADRRNLRIRAQVARAMAERLRAFADDPDRVEDLVERSRQEAWQDVADQMRRRMRLREPPPPEGIDPTRSDRIADLAAELSAASDASAPGIAE